jgi:hypothetical protein
MSIPFVWQEVEWRSNGVLTIRGASEQESLVPTTITGHAIVDGGILELSDRALSLQPT